MANRNRTRRTDKHTAYRVKSHKLRRALRGLKSWRNYPQSEAEERIFADFYDNLTNAATDYARKVARRAVNTIGKGVTA